MFGATSMHPYHAGIDEALPVVNSVGSLSSYKGVMNTLAAALILAQMRLDTSAPLVIV